MTIDQYHHHLKPTDPKYKRSRVKCIYLYAADFDNLGELVKLLWVDDDAAGVQLRGDLGRFGLSTWQRLLYWVLGLLMQKGAVGLRASLGLSFPVTGGYISLLGPNLQVSEDAVILGAVTLL